MPPSPTEITTKNASFHAQSKHIDVVHHFVRERVEMNQITFNYLPTRQLPADALTQAVAGPKLTQFRGIMGIC
jgi:hypothetical protein